jgi:uncharacterized membrane protein
MVPKLAAYWERLRTSLWFIPGLMALGSLVLVWAALQVRFDPESVWWLHRGSARDASELLSSLLSSLITMATLIISITMVVLTLAAGQLGPRLIRNFMGDWRTQSVLGLFIGTIVYLLMVLRLIQDGAPADQVPHFAVTGATVLVLLCVFTLLFYVHHLARSIIADTVINRVGRELDEAIRTFLPPEVAPTSRAYVSPHESPAMFGFRQSGYVQAVDFHGLAKAAEGADAYIKLMFRPGHHLLAGGTHIQVWPSHALTDKLKASIEEAVVLGEERTPVQDVEFAVRQLVEIALRALSPGINDPFTAIAAVDRLGASLALLLERPDAQRGWTDRNGRPRLTAPSSDFAGVADVTFNHIRQAATQQPSVLIRMLEKIGQLAVMIRTDQQRDVLLQHAEMVAEAGRRSLDEPRDQADLQDRLQAVRNVLEQQANRTSPIAGGQTRPVA